MRKIKLNKRYYPVECPKCGWVGSSEFVDGGYYLAGCDDYEEIYCPICKSEEIFDRDSIYYPMFYPLGAIPKMWHLLTHKYKSLYE